MARARTTTPSKSGDARAKKSAQAMHEAFLSLVEHKSLDEITIKEITERAGVSYPTFFRRYANKTELLEEIATDEVRAVIGLGQLAFDRAMRQDAYELCLYVHERRRLWAVLLNGGAANAMREEFKHFANETARSRPQANPWLPIELAVPFVTSGIFEILAWWLRQPADYPLDKVVRIMNALIVEVTARPREIEL